ncbi:MAG: hypothetical protein AABY01_01530 [Nanoarchaeota archaeon]
MLSRKGQIKPPSGGAAASVIGIIAILLIFYILFLPPENRRELLFGDDNKSSIDGDDTDGRTLLLANIGKLDYQSETSFDHTIPNVYLVETKNAQVLDSFNPFIVRNGWFVNEPKTVLFTVPQPDLTSNIKLVLDASVRTGILNVALNDKVVYEARPTSVNVNPIDLRDVQRSNTLTFSTSGVGLAFWRVNEYDLSNVQIIGDTTDIEKQESANVITLEPTEARNVEKASLTFFPICTQQDVGALTVLVNNAQVSQSTPDCQSVNRIELDPTLLSAGRNTVLFKISKGNYRIEQIKVKTELKEAPSYIDYFQLNETQFDDVIDKDKKLTLKITFVDDKEQKRAEININGKRDFIDQKTPTYERDLISFAVEDNNYLELIPKTTLNIAKLEVVLE